MRIAIFSALLVSIFAAPSVASADVIPFEVEACSGKKEGAKCSMFDQPGTCAKSTCSKLDYSNGTPPKPKSYDCVVCQIAPDGKPIGPNDPPPTDPAPQDGDAPALADAAPSGDDTPAPSPDAEAKAPAEADKAEAGKAEAGKAGESKSDDAKAETKASGCAVGGGSTLGLLLLGAAAVLRRRRD
ncbi:MAG: MYXO-CTERM sorting domain-containing protein [Myxococcota bacterium]